MTAQKTSATLGVRRLRIRTRDGWTLTKRTVEACARHRITGLAGEAAFFTLISLPPLLVGLVSTLGYLARVLGPDTVATTRFALDRAAGSVLTPQAIETIVQPTLAEILGNGPLGVVSVGFLLALWSGSAALNVYIDTISVVYELAGERNIVRQRLMSVLLYAAGLITGVVLLPLLAVGPVWMAELVPEARMVIHLLYWPVIVVGSIAFLTTLYSLSVPRKTTWREHLPGAALALFVWIVGGLLLRIYLAVSIEHSPVYGTIAAPMGVLLWLYVTAFAVLLGATVNAQVTKLRSGTAE